MNAFVPFPPFRNTIAQMAVPDPILGFQGLGKKARITRTRFINLKEIA
jgi:hypothetical protein